MVIEGRGVGSRTDRRRGRPAADGPRTEDRRREGAAPVADHSGFHEDRGLARRRSRWRIREFGGLGIYSGRRNAQECQGNTQRAATSD
jgi:hypothetical protein